MLEDIFKGTLEYIEKMPKIKRKSIGQFFTGLPTAQYMGGMAKCKKEEIRIVDAGAGTGLLAASVLEKLLKNGYCKNIYIDFFENNVDIIPFLESNITQMKEHANNAGKNLYCNIIRENFILYNKEVWNRSSDTGKYDIAISNPPYKKIGKNDPESVMMPEVIYGQPNIYFLFMAMATKLLKESGEFIFIVPRSWTAGLYFTAFRHYFFDNMCVTNLHLFVSRDKVFENEKVLQETMIIRAEKIRKKVKSINITSSNGYQDFNNISSFSVPYETCVKSNKNRFMYLPTSVEDVNILECVNRYPENLESMGLKLKTGLTVDFRATQWIRSTPSSNTVPLFWAFHFNGGRVHFPLPSAENQNITTECSSLLMKNTNYLFIKRFTSKEESRRLQPAIYCKNDFKDYAYISTENHLNFITRLNGEMTDDEVYGLYVIFASTLWDKYFRILNGSTQVNATEINIMPIPNMEDIFSIGKKARRYSVLTTQICDSLVEELKDEERRCKENFSSPRHACKTAS